MPQKELRFNDLYNEGDIRVIEHRGQVTIWEIGKPESWLDAPDHLVIEDLTAFA